MTTEYQITVDLPTAKKFVEVVGLGLFENGKTTVLTDEQLERWFNRPRSAGGDPLANFQEGIEVKEVPRSKSSGDKEDKAPDKSVSTDSADTGKGDT